MVTSMQPTETSSAAAGTRPALRTLGLVGGALGVAAVAYTLIVQITTPGPGSPDVVYVFSGLGSLVVGTLLINRQPRNVIGWILLSHGLIWTITETARSYLWASYEFGPQPLDELAIWILAWMSAPAWLLVPLLIAYFPNGKVTTRWLRWPVRVGAVILGIFVLTGMLVPGELNDPSYWLEGLRNEWGIQWLEDFAEFGEVTNAVVDGFNVYWLVLALVIVVDVVRRWRMSAGIERLQMRWFGFGVLATLLALLVSAVMARLSSEYSLLERFLLPSAIGLVPVSIGVAASRYRLYDIDRLVSRTVSYTLVGGLTAAVFAGVILTLGSLLPVRGPGSVAVSTLAAAAVFNPLRRRVQRWVDRRFNRARYDAELEVYRFAERLRDNNEVDTLREDLIGVIQTTLQPSVVGLWIARKSGDS